MKGIVHYTQCPVCGSGDLTEAGKPKDNTVSGEFFTLLDCGGCKLRFTQDVPDAASIGVYYKSEDYISHTNTAKGLINSLYHSVRKRTLQGKRKLVFSTTGLAKGKLLDVGSGIGSFVHEVKEHGWQVTGLEPDPDARKVGNEQYGIELEPISRLYQLEPGSFDAITLWHVLEHVHDLHAYIQQLRRLLTEKGKIFIAVPNYTSRDAASYKENWAAYDVPRHLYHFSPHAIDVLMQKNDLKVLQYKPMWYDSFYISLLSSKYKNGSTNWLGAFFTGLASNFAALKNVKRCSSVIYIISK